jgi:UDP-galactopyranose mutase
MTYDLVVVGSGFSGSVIAERAASADKRVLLLEKRSHIGGNSWSEFDTETGIEYHVYGSHIFHTSEQRVWAYIRGFTDFNDYRHTVYTQFKNRIYSMPINLGTINAFFDINLKPFEVDDFIRSEIAKENIDSPSNLEEKAVSLIGRSLYEAFIKGYTVKQWDKDPRELSADIIARLPVRQNYNNRYFNDKYEGIPIEGYGTLFERMLNHPNIKLELNTDYFDVRQQLQGVPTVYTGPIDRFFNFCHGRLEWRTICFERKVVDVPDYQGTAVVNYAEAKVPWTRIHEFRHYHPERQYGDKSLIFREYSSRASVEEDPYYPVDTERNRTILDKYLIEAKQLNNIWFSGRLGLYRYLDMDDAIAGALKLYEEISKFL